MKNKGLETLLYSTIGVVAMALILIGFNVITSAGKQRLDLTQEKAYTLSAGTRAILAKLDTPVKIRFYCTQSEQSTPETVFLKSYARRVEDLLGEFKQAARGKLILEKYNPQPDSDAEDSARLDGIQGEALSGGEAFYLGLAVSQLDEKQAIPFLAPNRERLMEYDIARAIARVVNPAKPVVGVMSALPIWGQPSNPMMMQMGQRGSEPWVLLNELRNDFTVKRVEMTAETIDDDIRVLMVIHPKEISDKTQFALDQFILRGGKLVAFLDPYSVVDSRGQNPMMGGMSSGSSSSLDKLLKAWGVTFESGKVVADMNLKMQLGGPGGRPQDQPTWIGLTKNSLDKDDVTTSELGDIWLPMAGAFSGTPVAGLKQTVLFKSTKDSQLVEGFMASLSGEQVIKDFKSSDKEQALAIRLFGKFKTAFPDGKPGEAKPDAGDTNAPAAPANFLKESKADTAVVLVGDSDLLYDQFTVRTMDTPFGRMATPMNANLNFAQNCVEVMSGDSDLIQVRSRATLNRPFDRVKRMQTAANQRYQGEISKLEKGLAETQQRLNELQSQKKDKNQRFILSPEQEAELAKFRQEEASARKHLKQVQKDLRREIVSLENTVKWVNILAMPMLVSLFGIGLAVVKSKRTGAK